MHRQPNQYLPRPPIEDLKPIVKRYWDMRKNDKDILRILLADYIDTDKYSLSINTFREMRTEMGFVRGRSQKHTLKSIRPVVVKLRKKFPLVGARGMADLLFHEHDMSVPRSLIYEYFETYEHELIKQRKAKRLKRRRFWAAGVFDLICVDQHDKWKRFGLAFHIGEDPFPGKIHWLKVWHNNNNPRLILSYYLDWMEVDGYMPLITQSDLGSENYGIANAQTILRQWNDPRLEGTVQHRWMRSKKNVKPEIAWSQFRRRWSPGFEDILEEGVREGWYDITDPIDALTFRWLFIPWIQAELDAYVKRINNTRKRADRNKILPHGPPNDISHSPERYGALDFKVKVQKEAIDHVRKEFAPPDDPVFELVPPAFARYAGQVYEAIGSPAVDEDNIWHVYRQMVERLGEISTYKLHGDEDYIDAVEQFEVSAQLEDQEIQPQDFYPLIEGRELEGGFAQPMEDGSIYLGGVNGGRGLDAELCERLDEIDNDKEDFEPGEIIFSEDEEDPEGYDEW